MILAYSEDKFLVIVLVDSGVKFTTFFQFINWIFQKPNLKWEAPYYTCGTLQSGPPQN